MNKKPILSGQQMVFLELFAGNKELAEEFYLTGGTALAEFYMPYRYSEDLDFFSEKEVDTAPITVFLHSIKDKIGYSEYELNSSFNRNLVFLKTGDSSLKLEFTYFPFQCIQKPRISRGIKIDSIVDIAVNKLFTIYQKPRSRDFIDLYMIQKKYAFSTEDLIKKARNKFDWHIDRLKLGAQFLLCEELKDYPRLIEAIDESEWQGYFRNEAKKFGKTIIE